jgi:hypothetical protein
MIAAAASEPEASEQGSRPNCCRSERALSERARQQFNRRATQNLNLARAAKHVG